MAARRRKSKKPSAGSAHSPCPSPPDDFVLYLDENLCNSRAIIDTLTKLGIHFERHLAHFAPGTPGNMSGQDMAAALELALGKMQRLCRKIEPPFVASITRAGEVHLRWPKT